MAHASLRRAQRLASNFTEDWADQFESWQQDPTDSVNHDQVMRDHRIACMCADFEETITLLNGLLGAICHLTERHRMELLAGNCRCNPQAESSLQDGLRDLSHALAVPIKGITRFERSDFQITGAKEFRSYCEKIDRFVQDDNRRRDLAERVGYTGVVLEGEAADLFSRIVSDSDRHSPRSKYGSEAATLIDPSSLIGR